MPNDRKGRWRVMTWKGTWLEARVGPEGIDRLDRPSGIDETRL